MDSWERAIVVAEMRREELLRYAEQERLVKQAVGQTSNGKPRATILSEVALALRARIDALRRPALTTPIELTPAAPETA